MAYGWDPGEWGGIRDVPILGDAWKGVFGDPESTKAAYDKMIAMAQQGGQELKNFYLGRQANAQQYFKPVQNMFNQMYGNTGVAAPQVPQAPGRTQAMYEGMK